MNYYSESREIIPGLMVGNVNDVENMVSWGASVLVPLAFMDANVWNTPFRGEILYYPTEDWGVLPEDVLCELVDKICCRLDEGKKVGLFCAGGHGRTGYVAACVLAKRGVTDPIGFLRREYSPKAVESEQQAKGIFEYITRIKKGDTPLYGDDIPFPGVDFTYSKEEGIKALIEDIDHAKSELESGYTGEAEEDFKYILEGLEKGRYNVDEDTVKSQIAVIEKILKASVITPCESYSDE